MYKGQLQGFPNEVVEKMLERQVEQGNKRDVSVFERFNRDCVNGFSWANTKEEYYFWDEVICEKNFNLFFEKYPKEEEIKLPTTEQERDKLIDTLKSMEFNKELHSKLLDFDFPLSKEELKLFKLLRMRDVYRDGWVSDKNNSEYNFWIWYREDELVIECSSYCSAQFSFQNEETAELFLKNFRKDLEEVKHLIS